MSMPSLPEPNPNLTKEQALNMILASIALEETALSHIINAEGEKIQHIISNCSNNTDDIISVNNSVKEMLEVVLQNQIILKSKMEKVLAYLPKPCDKTCCNHCNNHNCKNCCSCDNKECGNECHCHRHNCDCFVYNDTQNYYVFPCCNCENEDIECDKKVVMSNFAKSHVYCDDV
ncbi:MAG: hypothetical protein GX896_03575 [Clostridiales bacterium]|nr:hypothetical protein [Clostridiales bacterium]